jgi:type IV secretory pathway VirB3-like protein
MGRIGRRRERVAKRMCGRGLQLRGMGKEMMVMVMMVMIIMVVMMMMMMMMMVIVVIGALIRATHMIEPVTVRRAYREAERAVQDLDLH